MNLYKKLKMVLSEEQILVQEPMSRHTTFRVGGPADYFVLAASIEEVQGVVLVCLNNQVPYYILGNGSNLLVGDKGYRGVVIQIYKEMSSISVEGTRVSVQAGALLSKVAAEVLAFGLTGFEFAAGIPGTLGGAVAMNAGAYGGEMKQVLESATVLADTGEILVLNNEQLKLGYRTSVIASKGYIVIAAVLQLKKGDTQAIRRRMEELKGQRVSKQPLEHPSAGSTFKRPEGYFAGKLIEDAGLRGYRHGGAAVSEKHCGFVVNDKNATAAEVVELIRQVVERVEANSGVRLEPEVKKIGEF